MSHDRLQDNVRAELIARLKRVIRWWLDLHASMLAAPDPTSLTPAEADALDVPDEGLGRDWWTQRDQTAAAYQQGLAERLEGVRGETRTILALLRLRGEIKLPPDYEIVRAVRGEVKWPGCELAAQELGQLLALLESGARTGEDQGEERARSRLEFYQRRLKDLGKARLSQRQFSLDYHIDPKTLSNWLKGKNNEPFILKGIAKGLGVEDFKQLP